MQKRSINTKLLSVLIALMMLLASLPLYAQESYAVTFYIPSSDGSASAQTVNIPAGEAIGDRLPASPTIDGRVFIAWMSGSTEVTADTVPTGNMTVLAKTEALPVEPEIGQFKVTFMIPTDTEVVPYAVLVTEGEAIGDRLPDAPVINGRKFIGWFAGGVEVTSETIPSADMNVYAKTEEAVEYTVTFVIPANAAGESITERIVLDKGEKIGDRLPASPVIDGRKFIGWFADGVEITSETVPSSDLTVFAKTEANVVYTIVFYVPVDAEGNTQLVEVTVSEGNAIASEDIPEAISLDGMDFEGWYFKGNLVDLSAAPTEDMSLTAKYVPHVHEYTDTVSVPTCTDKGFTTHTCACGYTYTDSEVDALGHTEETISAIAPTCTDKGMTEGKRCTVCGEVTVKAKDVAALGHDYSAEWTVDVEATYTTAGSKSRHCTRCDAKTDVATIPVRLDSAAMFADVDDSSWFKSAVDFALERGLMKGVSDDRFAPNDSLDRGMLITILWRLEGAPASDAQAPFTDLTEDWYKTAVAWAYENEIVMGVSATEYAPGAKITREQIAAVLYRYSQFKGYDISERGDLGDFSDHEKVSDYAKDALSWAIGQGLVIGIENGDKMLLSPDECATRAQAAVIFERFCSIN